MDWVRNNRFMAGFLAFLVVGAGALGYLLYTSYGHYNDVAQEYDRQVKELQRLQALKPFPDDEGLKKFSEFRQNYAAEVNALQVKLAAYEPPPDKETITPIQFADKLRKTVDDISGAAQGVGMALPTNFYMGFESYRNTPPDAAATPLLSRELDAMTELVQLLIKQRAVSLNLIKRAPLPREPGASNPAAASAASRAGGKPGSDLVVRYPVEIGFTSQPSSFHEVINAITSANRLYVIQALEIKNKEQKGPLREDPAAAATRNNPGFSQPPPPPGSQGVDPNGVPNPNLPAAGPPPLRYVVGLEKIDADLRLELVKVEPPSGVR